MMLFIRFNSLSPRSGGSKGMSLDDMFRVDKQAGNKSRHSTPAKTAPSEDMFRVDNKASDPPNKSTTLEDMFRYQIWVM